MSYTRWSDCDYYTYSRYGSNDIVSAHPITVLTVSPAPIIISDNGEPIVKEFTASQVRKFLSGANSMNEIPGWLEVNQESRDKMKGVFLEFLADTRRGT